MLGGIFCEKFLELNQILAHSVAQSQTIYIMRYLPQVALLTDGGLAQELLQCEPLLERHWPFEMIHLDISANAYDIDPLAVLGDSKVQRVHQLVVDVVACSRASESGPRACLLVTGQTKRTHDKTKHV